LHKKRLKIPSKAGFGSVFLVNSNDRLLVVHNKYLKQGESDQVVFYVDHLDVDGGCTQIKTQEDPSGVVLFLGQGCSVAL
jgi:hypothetical protein